MSTTSKNNTLSVVLDIVRAAVGRGTFERKVPCTLEGIEEIQIVEQKLTAGATGVAVNFGPIATADAMLVFTPKAIAMHINDADAPAVQCGSVSVLLNTSVTSLHLDNNIETTPVDTVVEIWLIALTG